jgi:dihydrolipoamide dehydrogenase
VIGGGPGGHAAATTAASYGAQVTLVEDQILGGAAHLWDCVPSKALVASSMRLASIKDSAGVGITDIGSVDIHMDRLAAHVESASSRLAKALSEMLESQGVDVVEGRGRFTGPHTAMVTTEDGEREIVFDKAVVSTGSKPRVPPFAQVDGHRILTTRHAYSLPELPKHIIVIGSGVTGVEMVHIFSSLGSDVSLLVSRQHVLPLRDAEVAAVLENDFLARGVSLLKGARADGIEARDDEVVVTTTDGRTVTGTHALIAVGAVPNTSDIGLDLAGVDIDERGNVVVDEMLRTSAPHIYAAGDITGMVPLSSVATTQGTKIGRHILGHEVAPVDYNKVAQAIFTRPEIATVGLEEVHAASEGRKVRITKVPFAANTRSLIDGYPAGFVKVISDPATRVVLGGTIVGQHASDLIAPIALAVTARLRVDVLFDTIMVHPSLSESISEAAE